jgi:hypothetical protein
MEDAVIYISIPFGTMGGVFGAKYKGSLWKWLAVGLSNKVPKGSFVQKERPV